MQTQVSEFSGTAGRTARPDRTAIHAGALRFNNECWDKLVIEKAYERLDFSRATRAFHSVRPGALLAAVRKALAEAGVSGNTIAICDARLEAKLPLLCMDTKGLYAMAWVDLKGGPMVVEIGPNSLAVVDDAWFHFVADLGSRGPDLGKGGKYLFLPPDYRGDAAKGYFVFRSPTYGNWLALRALAESDDVSNEMDRIKQRICMYPVTETANPPEQTFVNLTGTPLNPTHASGLSFFEEVNSVVQAEPADSLDPETVGLLASIGIERGQPFKPDDRMRRILAKAADAGNTTAGIATFPLERFAGVGGRGDAAASESCIHESPG